MYIRLHARGLNLTALTLTNFTSSQYSFAKLVMVKSQCASGWTFPEVVIQALERWPLVSSGFGFCRPLKLWAMGVPCGGGSSGRSVTCA